MPFQIVRNNIAEMDVDAIVNTANPLPVVGGGCDTAIHRAAGPELMEARKPYGKLETGKPVITPGFRLKAKYVIHVAGPVWRGGDRGEEGQLHDCYAACLALAAENRCESVAFPLLSAGTYGFPADRALQIAMETISAFLMQHDMKIFLAVLGGKALALSNSLFPEITAYVDDHYAGALLEEEYRGDRRGRERRRPHDFPAVGAGKKEKPGAPHSMPGSAREDVCFDSVIEEGRPEEPEDVCEAPTVPSAYAEEKRRASVWDGGLRLPSLEELLKRKEEDFPSCLNRLLREKDLIEKEVYVRANIDRKLFSKIRCGKGYVPKKATALALCIGLQLTVEQAEDFLRTGGYSLTNSDKRDLVVRWFLEHRNYDMFTIETYLEEHGMPVLTSIA